MSNSKPRAFSISEGIAAAKAELGALLIVLLAVFIGIMLHWIWEVAIAALQSGGDWVFGSKGIIVARIVIAFILGLMTVLGVWKQTEQVDPIVRFFMALIHGFALDALESPVAEALNNQFF